MNKFLLTLAAAALFTAAAAGAQAAEPRTLTVTGKATISVLPDTATIYASVETGDADAGKAASRNAAVTDRIWAAVTAAGADRDASSTSSYNLWPEYAPKDPQSIQTYRVTNAMKIVTHDLTKAGAISDAALKAGASRIQSVQFSLENENEYKNQALQLAAAESRKKAALIAQSLGCEITGILSVTASAGSGPVRFRLANAAMDSASGGAAPTGLVPEKQEITQEATVVFEIR